MGTALPRTADLLRVAGTGAPARAWLAAALEADAVPLGRLLSQAPRIVGRASINSEVGRGLVRTADEAARCVLVAAASRRTEPGRFAGELLALWRRGDLSEKIAIIRSLPVLREPGGHLALALDA